MILPMLFAFVLPAQQAEVAFSVPGGFYDSVFHVVLSCSEEELVIHYTNNGNVPTVSSKVYSNPLLLGENLYSHSDIYTIQCCPDSVWYPPDSVKHCIVIRAAAFDAKGNRVSEVVTQSYFIRSLGCDTHGLPVVSLCADSLDLFDYERGIMVPGICCDSANQYWTGNYYQKGRQWERPCNFEFYEADSGGINQQAGLRMHGSSARAGQQKGLKLYARKEYGEPRFQYVFFKELENRSFKHLVLKPFCHRGASHAVQDRVCSQIEAGLAVESLASRFVVLYINGEYWGIYDFKEKPDEHYLADHYGCSPQSIDMVESWNGKVSCGDNTGFIEMMRWFVKADLSSDEDYRKACSLIDVDSFIDYYCLELFIGNYDWPYNNMRCWREGEGKWRWLFFDGDDCLDGSDNVVSSALTTGGKVTESNLLFNKLLMNQDFRDRFYGRFGRLMTNQFDYETTSAYLEANIAKVRGEVENHVERFGRPESVSNFDQQMWHVNHFLRYRVLNMSSLLYRFYYYNGWKYNCSEIASQKSFKINLKRHDPKFLLRMALQFKDWRYVEIYHAYMRLKRHEAIKTSGAYRWWSGTWLFRKMKRS